MKRKIDHSIGAALQAYASQTPARKQQRRSKAPARRNRGVNRGRDGQGASRIHLTPRELEVLVLVGEGLCNKKICERLEIAEGTVKSHMSSLFKALEADNRTELVVKAIVLGIIQPTASSRSEGVVNARRLEIVDGHPAARSRLAAVMKASRLGIRGEPPASNQTVPVSPLPAGGRAGKRSPGHSVFADA